MTYIRLNEQKHRDFSQRTCCLYPLHKQSLRRPSAAWDLHAFELGEHTLRHRRGLGPTQVRCNHFWRDGDQLHTPLVVEFMTICQVHTMYMEIMLASDGFQI